MKKILAFLFSGILALAFFMALNIYNFSHYQNEMFTGKTAINMVSFEEVTGEEILSKIQELCKEYSVNFSKYVFLDSENVSVFTTDLNAYRTSPSGGYSQILLPSNNQNIRVMPIEKLQESSSYDGLYYISSTNHTTINDIIADLNQTLGKSDVFAYNDSTISVWISYIQSLRIYFSALVLLIVSGLITLFVIAKIAISESKAIAILHLNGYSNYRVFSVIARKLYPSLLWSLAFSFVFAIIILAVIKSLRFFFILYCINLGFFFLLTLIGMAALLVTIKVVDNQSRKIDIVKGNATTKTLLLFQFLLKYAMIAFAVLLFTSILSYQNKINTYMTSETSWFQTENIYNIVAKFVTNDISEKRKLELRAKDLYQELEKDAGAFLIQSRNFDVLSSGKYVWEENAKEGYLYSSWGKSITVNLNYLKRHPVFDTDGNDIVNRINIDDSVWNILVPSSLKDDEEAVRAGFLQDFIFKKVEVPQIYNQEIGESIIPVNINRLSLNLIYVSDSTGYFTYNKDIMPEAGNLIIDPCVIVDTGNLDASFYFSSMTNSVYFESYNPEPFLEISQTVAKYNLLSTFDSVEAIYDTRAQEIQSLAEGKTVNTLVMIIITFLLVFFIFLLDNSYFEYNKHTIFIKYIFGYSLTRICGIKLLVELLLDIIVVSFCGNLSITIAIVLMDVLFNYLFSVKLYANAALKVIKGGNE